MAVGRCEHCGTEEYMPFVCKFCKGRFCVNHRLPENHRCRGLEGYKERVRHEGRLVMPEGGYVAPTVRRSAAWRARISTAFERVEGKMAYVFLGIMAAFFILQVIVSQAAGQGRMLDLFALHTEFWRAPWTLVTSVFAHGSINHFFFNGLALFFFGPTVERLIGTRRFTWLFLASGILAGLAQVLIFGYVLDLPSAALGASGALMGIMGALVVLAPKLSVLLMFVLPVPLWGIVALYAVIDLAGAISDLMTPGLGSNVAHFAHLAGLAAGAYYGLKLKREGLRVHTQPPQGANMRRPF